MAGSVVETLTPPKSPASVTLEADPTFVASVQSNTINDSVFGVDIAAIEALIPQNSAFFDIGRTDVDTGLDLVNKLSPFLPTGLYLPVDMHVVFLRGGNAVTAAIQQEARRLDMSLLDQLSPQTAAALLDLSMAIAKTSEFKRLQHVRQMTTSYTSKGRGSLTHDRQLHSFDVANQMLHLIIRSGIKDQERIVHLVSAALLHDIGHGPFSHASESALVKRGPGLLKAFGLDGTFHHEKWGWRVLQNESGEIAQVLDDHNVDIDEVLSILRSETDVEWTGHTFNPCHTFLDWSDRLAYLIRDLLPQLNGPTRRQTLKDVAGFTNRVECAEDGELVVLDENRALRLLVVQRLDLVRRAWVNPESLLVDRMVEEELSLVLQMGDVDAAAILLGSDRLLIQKFRPFARQIFEEALAWGAKKGVDSHFNRLAAFSLSDFTDEGRAIVSSPDFQSKMREALGMRGSANISDLYVTCAPKHNKEIKIQVGDAQEPFVPPADLPQDDRGICFWARKDADFDLAAVIDSITTELQPLFKTGIGSQADYYNDPDEPGDFSYQIFANAQKNKFVKSIGATVVPLNRG